MVKKGAGSSRLVSIFVRIGALRRFHALTQKTADLPVEVKWDRRRSDRGDTPAEGSPEQPDRRQKPPYTWEVADFVVVEDASSDPKAPAKKD
jgi:hypothetical protein